MSIGTVFPEMVMGIAETVTEAMEPGENKNLTGAEIREIAAACRETRDKFNSMANMFEENLSHGVDATAFLKQTEPRLARLDKLLLRHSASLAQVDRFQAAWPESQDSSAMRELIADFESLGKAMSLVRDLLKEAISKMKTPRPPLDWQRVQQAQEAFLKGETKPIERISGANGE